MCRTGVYINKDNKTMCRTSVYINNPSVVGNQQFKFHNEKTGPQKIIYSVCGSASHMWILTGGKEYMHL